MLEQTASCSDNCGSTCKKPACENSTHTHIHGSTSWVLHVACVVCVQVYMSVLCKCVCTHTCTHMHTYIHIYIHTLCGPVHLCKCSVCDVHVCMHVTRVHAHTHTHMHIHTPVGMCMCLQQFVCDVSVYACVCVHV